jgi:tripartite ATP-independent transporter DctP family solute receptor
LAALTLVASIALAACGSNATQPSAGNTAEPGKTEAQQQDASASSGEAITLKVGLISAPEHSYTLGLKEYDKALREATNGKVKLELYGDGQLGGEREMTEQVQLGTLDMALITSAPVGNFAPDLSVLEMPFLFRDLDHVYKTLDGEIGQELLAKLDDSGIKGIALWENGLRHISNNKKPILSPEDVKGMKMRTIENDIVVETIKALGADATPIAFPEVYTSFQQGVVDGFDASYGVFESTKMYEVQKHFSEVGIFYNSAVLMINKEKFDSFPADLQETIVKLGRETAAKQRQINQDLEKKQRANMEANGVQIVNYADVDVEAFRKAVEDVYTKIGPRFGDYVERIRAVQ